MAGLVLNAPNGNFGNAISSRMPDVEFVFVVSDLSRSGSDVRSSVSSHVLNSLAFFSESFLSIDLL